MHRLLALSFLALPLVAQSDWDEPFPPHRVAGNLYYVGSKGLSSYLITSPEGHILINPSFDRTVPIIRAAIEKLGFRFADVKILLTSHAHDDHIGGCAMVRELTGAKVFIMEGDADVVRRGGEGQYLYKGRWKPCTVDRVLKDGEEVTLGGSRLRAHLTPGHTRGNTTWSMTVNDEGTARQAVIVGSPNVNAGFQLVNNKDYPEMAADFARTFRVLKALDCDLFLGAHGQYYDMANKYKRLGKGPNPFLDPAGYKEYIAEREQFYLYTLETQQKQ